MKNIHKNRAMKLINEHINLKQYNIIYMTYSGSRLHGSHDNKSDLDIKGIFVPSLQNILIKFDTKEVRLSSGLETEKNNSSDLDIELVSIYTFLERLSKGEANSVELLFSMFSEQNILLETKESNVLKDQYKDLLTYKIDAFIGFSMKMASKYTIKGDRVQELTRILNFINSLKDKNQSDKQFRRGLLKDYEHQFKVHLNKEGYSYIRFVIQEDKHFLEVLNRKWSIDNQDSLTIGYFLSQLNQLLDSYGARVTKLTNENIDWKALSHALRALLEAKEYVEKSFISFPRPEAKTLLEIKRGKLNIQTVSKMIETAKEEIPETSVLKIRKTEKILKKIFKSLGYL